MPPKGALPQCGFAVRGTKKGDLPLKTEKRARGKKVTLIPNVTGDASKLARGLQAMLGVGGTARRAEAGFWVVEVQGDQIARVTKALLDFDCLQGLSRESAEALRAEGQRGEEVSVVARTAASKFLVQTRTGGAMSPEEERRRLLEMEAEFYGRFWQTAAPPAGAAPAGSLEDLLDVFELETAEPDTTVSAAQVQALPELNAALRGLGLLAECGSAVREFWEGPGSGMTLAQFRREALRFGARLITEEPGRKKKPSNLKSRQKISDLGSGARANYFSCTCSAIDDYQRGVVRTREQREAEVQLPPEEPKLVTSTDAEGWCSTVLSYCVPFPVPASRLEEEDRKAVSKDALRAVEGKVNGDLEGLSQNFPGLECRLDCNTFGVDLSLHERQFLHAGRRDTGKQPDRLEKEELKLEKKLREISGLQKRAVEGEALDKLQSEKVSRRGELFEQVAELKLRRAEKDLLKVFKRHSQSFQDAFWDLEWKAMYGETSKASDESASKPFGTFDEDGCEGPASLSADCSRAEGRPAQWAGARLHLSVRDGEVGAFAVEILEGLARLGWVARGGALRELGSDRLGFGFGGTGKKVHAGAFEAYGPAFKAGDVVHCEAEREGGRLRIGFAKNSEPLGVAFDVEDQLGADSGLWGAVCGKGFKVRLTSAECMPLEEAPGLEEFVEYDPPRMAVVRQDFREESEGCLQLWAGETVNVSSDNGEGWLFGFFLDPEDPDDGGWFPAEAIRFLDVPEAWGPADVEPEPPAEVEAPRAAATAETAERAAAPTAAAASSSPVEGLGEWLRGLSLQKYEARAVEWCLEMGAVSLEEVEEEWEDLAEALALKPLERKRLAKAVAR
mmetsp:Transcript_44179/g.127805  ORF Transcript_44179/g.127805 Transcript_44179/m.127805 type:complete len:846 (+) Transcript_44179:226-2763(+)